MLHVCWRVEPPGSGVCDRGVGFSTFKALDIETPSISNLCLLPLRGTLSPQLIYTAWAHIREPRPAGWPSSSGGVQPDTPTTAGLGAQVGYCTMQLLPSSAAGAGVVLAALLLAGSGGGLGLGGG